MQRDYPEHDAYMVKRKADVVAQRTKELDQLRGEYLANKGAVQDRTDGKDVLELARLLKSYQPGEPSEKAIYIVAQATMLIHKLVSPFAIVRNYEEKERALEELRK